MMRDMRIVALLAWYDEPPGALRMLVESLAPVCDGVVAVDGAYADFPGGWADGSPLEQGEVLRRQAKASGLDLTLYEPRTLWGGQEIGKRDFLFRAGELVTEPEDWYLVIDGDEMLDEHPGDLRRRLAETPYDAAQVTVYEPDLLTEQRSTRLIRAVRGLSVVDRHYNYVAPDGRHLSGDDPEPTLRLTEQVRIRHNRAARPPRRAAASDRWSDMLRHYDEKWI